MLSAESGYGDRFFYLLLDDTDIVTGRHLTKIPKAVEEVCQSLDHTPSAVMICITCVDALLGTDMDRVCRKSSDRAGVPVVPVMNYLREHDDEPESIEEISKEGYGGVLCIETGGPTPGLGCAGRGIITTFSLLEDLKLFEKYKPDVVLYDVLGDVVCGGFAAPIREGYASKVLIVTSGEKMALYAANNINSAVKNFADRSYAKVRGIVMNRRNVEGEEEKVRAFAESAGLDIVADIPRSDDIIRCEDKGMTVIEGEPDCQAAKCFLKLAQTLMQEDNDD